MRFTVRHGVLEADYARAAELYDLAFGPKFVHIVPDRDRRVRLFARVMDGERAYGAYGRDGELLGLAGYHEDERAFTGAGGLRDLLDELGVLGTLRAVPGLLLFERKPSPNELLMDGICVAPDARGRGIGRALLRAVQRHAGTRTVSLDVIDTNPRARSLYERAGFVPGATERFPALRPLLGFSESTRMAWSPSSPRGISAEPSA